MEKDYLKKILFNYKRDLKRLEHLREKYYSIQSIKYDKDRVQRTKENKDVEKKVVSLLSDPEYQELDKQTKAVERMMLILSEEESTVLKHYFFERKRVYWLELNIGYSRPSIYRVIDKILYKLELEIM